MSQPAFLNFAEARALASRRLPKGIFDYIDRGAEDDLAIRANREAFDACALLPAVLNGMPTPPSTALCLFGENQAAPFIAAPTAFAGLVRYKGEIELAEACEQANVPFCAATEAITSIEEIAKGRVSAPWMQLYLWDQPDISLALMQRAWDCGSRTLVFTVDTPVMPKREFNIRNGFSMPFTFNRRNVTDVMRHPHWACSVFLRYLLSGGVPDFANYPPQYRQSLLRRGREESLDLMPGLNWQHVEWVRQNWPGQLIVKGLLRPDDARKARDCGVEGIVVSNHGGRMLDTAVPPLRVLKSIADAVGTEMTVLADSSIRRGSDIFKLLAAGAKAVLLGRSLLYATAAQGAMGAKSMLDILADELRMTMSLTGCQTLADIRPEHLIQNRSGMDYVEA